MSLKLLLIAVEGTLANSSNQLDPEITRQLASFISQLDERGVRVALWSTRSWTYNSAVPLHDHLTSISGVQVLAHGPSVDGSPARRLKNSALPVLAKYGVHRHEAMVLGGTDEDMRASVNSRLLHIRADWYGQQSDYGFSVKSVSELARFCFLFALRQHPVFWRVDKGPLQVWACGPFSTMTSTYAFFGEDARAAAKQGAGNPDFWFYLTVSTLYFAGVLDGVNYMCRYPGHSTNGPVTPWDEVLTRLCKCFQIGYYQDLVLRHSMAPKSQYTKAHGRLLSTQVNSIKLNAHPHRNLSAQPNRTRLGLASKTVLIVDDFLTSGRSLEAARAYLNAAGADVRCFAWLKTISVPYKEVVGDLMLKPYEVNTITAEPPTVQHSYEAGIVDAGAPGEITKLLHSFEAWSWS